MNNILEIKNLSKSLQETPIIKNINLTVKKGEILTLVGPSGSGKSTLLRCINRLIEPDSGTIYFNNEEYHKVPIFELRKKIILVLQESIMFPGTVRENILFGVNLQQRKHTISINQSILDAGLSESILEKNAEKLSGGEKKRVALARALALQPDILLLDEPTSGVDPKNIQTVEQNILTFTKQRFLTVLWVTHNIDQAKRVSNRIANVKDGTITTITHTKDFQWEVAY